MTTKRKYRTIWTFHHPSVKNKTFQFYLEVCVTGVVNQARFCVWLNGSRKCVFETTVGACFDVVYDLPVKVLHTWERRTCVWSADLIQWFHDTLKELDAAVRTAYDERTEAWARIKMEERKSKAITLCTVPKCWHRDPYMVPGDSAYYRGPADEDGIRQIRWYTLTTREQLEKDLPCIQVYCSMSFDYDPDKGHHDDDDDN